MRTAVYPTDLTDAWSGERVRERGAEASRAALRGPSGPEHERGPGTVAGELPGNARTSSGRALCRRRPLLPTASGRSVQATASQRVGGALAAAVASVIGEGRKPLTVM
jgi:hypothetical protein